MWSFEKLYISWVVAVVVGDINNVGIKDFRKWEQKNSSMGFNLVISGL